MARVSAGPEARKAKNLRANSHCASTSGCDTLVEGLDLLVAGSAPEVTHQADLRPVADAYLSKYAFSQPRWLFDDAGTRQEMKEVNA